MTIRTIKVKDQALYALNSRKRSGESYTDVILRIAGDNDTHCTKNKRNT